MIKVMLVANPQKVENKIVYDVTSFFYKICIQFQISCKVPEVVKYLSIS